MKLGSQTGSVVNHLMSGVKGAPRPVVGDGATFLYWTDRAAGTVIHVSPSGKTIKIQEDTATRIDANGMSETQAYAYTPNPTGKILTFRLTDRGWTAGRVRAHVGSRRAYHDFSF